LAGQRHQPPVRQCNGIGARIKARKKRSPKSADRVLRPAALFLILKAGRITDDQGVQQAPNEGVAG
jgi:hypothetical protein